MGTEGQLTGKTDKEPSFSDEELTLLRGWNLRKEFRDFLSWVFGPIGIPSVETVFYGDYYGRFARPSHYIWAER